MGKCEMLYQTIKFDVSDEEITHCEVVVKWIGDCPLAPSVMKKSFPKRMTVLEILEKEVPNCTDWI